MFVERRDRAYHQRQTGERQGHVAFSRDCHFIRLKYILSECRRSGWTGTMKIRPIPISTAGKHTAFLLTVP